MLTNEGQTSSAPDAESALRQFFADHSLEFSAGRGVGCRCGDERVAAGSDTLPSFWVDQDDIDAHRASVLAACAVDLTDGTLIQLPETAPAGS